MWVSFHIFCWPWKAVSAVEFALHYQSTNILFKLRLLFTMYYILDVLKNKIAETYCLISVSQLGKDSHREFKKCQLLLIKVCLGLCTRISLNLMSFVAPVRPLFILGWYTCHANSNTSEKYAVSFLMKAYISQYFPSRAPLTPNPYNVHYYTGNIRKT